jgi:hypothetical protein
VGLRPQGRARGPMVAYGMTTSALTYYKKVHGTRKLLHVKGITPRTCPHGGWPVASQFTFQDGSTVLSISKIPCPKR